VTDETMSRIAAVRTAATWMRKSHKPIEEYPKLSKLDPQMRQQAVQFAAGILPWPAKWTARLYNLAVNG
jgi:hypothetical protein